MAVTIKLHRGEEAEKERRLPGVKAQGELIYSGHGRRGDAKEHQLNAGRVDDVAG